jgi:hypothetical protein
MPVAAGRVQAFQERAMTENRRKKNLDSMINRPSKPDSKDAISASSGRSFEELAAEMRKRTQTKRQTPSEVLLREGRAER